MTEKKTSKDLPTILFETACDWERWLDSHHADPAGLWLKMAKKDSGLPSITYSEALDIALCYGWIDGQKGALDEQFYLQKFTPRRSKSLWSKRNVERVDALIKTGKMRAPGLAAVETARKDGRWERAYDSHRTSAMPPDLEEALEANPRAKALFSTLDKANIYAILWRLQTAKQVETRKGRLGKFIEMLNEGRKIHP